MCNWVQLNPNAAQATCCIDVTPHRTNERNKLSAERYAGSCLRERCRAYSLVTRNMFALIPGIWQGLFRRPHPTCRVQPSAISCLCRPVNPPPVYQIQTAYVVHIIIPSDLGKVAFRCSGINLEKSKYPETRNAKTSKSSWKISPAGDRSHYASLVTLIVGMAGVA